MVDRRWMMMARLLTVEDAGEASSQWMIMADPLWIMMADPQWISLMLDDDGEAPHSGR